MSKKKRSHFAGQKSLNTNGRIMDKANRRGRKDVKNYGPQFYFSQPPSVDDLEYAYLLINRQKP